MRKKKERTPKQIKRRFAFALILIGAMLLTVLILPSRKEDRDDEERIAAIMETQLDTLIGNMYGPGWQKQGAQKIDKIKELAPEYGEYKQLVELADNLRGSGFEGPLREKADSLKDLLNENPEEKTFYVRRIFFSTPDGKNMTGFQKTSEDLKRSELVQLAERIPQGQLQSDLAEQARKLEEELMNDENNNKTKELQ